MTSHNIKEILTAISHTHPNLVKKKFAQGDHVQKSAGRAYEIDDVHIYQKLGNFEKGVIPYTRIYHALQPSQQVIFSLFNGSSIIPFSRAVQSHAGECLEKAILVQLAAQTGRDSFFINGIAAFDDKIGAYPYAYNIIFKEGKPHLVDVHNPLKITKKEIHAYIAPVIAMRNKEFILPDDWKQNRHYTLA